MKANFDRCLEHVLRWEGGSKYTDHPLDPGGATKYGVTRRALANFRGMDVDKQDVKDLTLAEARLIYRAKYWMAVRGDTLPTGVDLIVFDAAVNHGPRRAIKFLQRALKVRADGAFGPITQAALATSAVSDLLWQYTARRNYAYGLLRIFKTFGLGWSNRSAHTHQTAMGMIR